MNDTVQVLPDGAVLVLEHPYTLSESKAAIVIVLFAFISLVASLALIGAISAPAFRRRMTSKPLIFVCTHATVYFILLTISVIVQNIGGIMTLAWVLRAGVFAGPICMAQAVLKHVGDVSIAVWTLVIAVQASLTIWNVGSKRPLSLSVFGHQVQRQRFIRWTTIAFAVLIIVVLLILGPELTSKERDDSFYGIAGEWCWITDGFSDARIIFGYLIMFLSAVISFFLYAAAFYRTRRNLRVLKPASEYILNEQDQYDEYKIKLSKYMIYYPLAYFVCILPTAVSRFATWGGDRIPFDVSIFTDTVYQLLGLVNAILYFFTPRMLPERTMFPEQFNTEEYKKTREDHYAHPWHKEEKKQFAPDRRPPPLQLAVPPLLKFPQQSHGVKDPFATPLYSATSGRKVTRVAIKQSWQRQRGLSETTVTLPRRATSDARSQTSSAGSSRRSSLASSINKPLPQAPKTNGLPAHPAARLSSSSTASAAAVQRDSAPHRTAPPGLPANPAVNVRTSQPSLETYLDQSQFTDVLLDSPSTISAPHPDINTSGVAILKDDVRAPPMAPTVTVVGSPVQWTLRKLSTPVTKLWKQPDSAASSASPLTGTVFQMVTQPGMYIAGYNDSEV